MARTLSWCLTRPHTTKPATPAMIATGRMNFIACERSTRIRVGAGIVACRLVNMPAKTGTMNSSMPMTARMAMQKTTTG